MVQGDPSDQVPSINNPPSEHIYSTLPSPQPNFYPVTNPNDPNNPSNTPANPYSPNVTYTTNGGPSSQPPNANINVNVNASPPPINYAVPPNGGAPAPFVQQQPGFVPVQYIQQPNGAQPQIVYQVQPGMGYPQGTPIVYVQAPGAIYAGPPVVYNRQAKGPYQGLAIAAYILFIISACFFYILDLPSMIMTFVLIHKRIIHSKHRKAALACTIIELIGWVFMPCIIWYTDTYCYTYSYDGYYYSYTDYICVARWWGWIGLVVWYVTLLAFGIPRIVFTYTSRNNHPEPK
eukprot:TRINITY_DN1282_c1_g1_i1.p1 TRINITY_DN1282_c1_g1~~TRINITY_DN1282_c1_g1_i1.p1  ORF type:complete len:290 (+),score=52.82 TRINITY_DN1282_c1_g1_i1:546-1415(+)